MAVTWSLSWEAVLLYVVVATFSSGFDIFNTVGDREFDNAHGVNSLPARFGVGMAFWVARCMHVIPASALLAVGVWLDLAWPYFVGWCIASILLIYEHLALSPGDMSRLRFVFSWINAGISLTLLTFTFLAVVMM